MHYHRKLMELVVRTTIKLTPNEKLVLIALANFTNEFGLAYPTLEQIRGCTGLSRSSVIRALEKCEERRLILRSKGHTGRATTYQFTCFRDYRFADELLGVSLTHQVRTDKLKEFKFIINNNLSAWGVSQTLIKTSFENFWEMYPKKVGYAHAYFAFVEATKLADPRKILEGLEDFMKYEAPFLDEQFIPHPVNWLEGGRWLDEHINPLDAWQVEQWDSYNR